MTYDAMGPGALDYLPCRYGKSKLLFRGPRRKLDKPYVAFLGGTETYGRFIEKPFPLLVEEETGLRCVNFGCLNAGTDVFARDPFIPQAAADASIVVVQVMGAQNMTNRFYTVHPRRNDRFVGPSDLLKTIFREVDFSEFHFNKHLLLALREVSVERFDTVLQELQAAWVARMRQMMGQMGGKTVLLWFSEQQPPHQAPPADGLGRDPLFVTREMIDAVAPHVTQVVEVVASGRALEEGTERMIFTPFESQAAQGLLGPRAHEEAAGVLSQVLRDI